MPYAAAPVHSPRTYSSGLGGRPWLLFHLCDLDAPAVAVAWQFLFAESFRAPVRVPAVLALALSVWLIYAIDRVLDTERRDKEFHTARHEFHRVYRKGWLFAIASGLLCLGITCCFLNRMVLAAGVVLGLSVLAYMCAVHLARRWSSGAVSKELVVGLLFAAGASLAPLCAGKIVPLHVTAVLLFGVLCCLNCSAIEVWEWNPLGSRSRLPHALSRFLVHHLRICLWMVLITGCGLFVRSHDWVFAAVALSAVGFLLVAYLRFRLSPDALRSLVDIPLLCPLLVLWLGKA